MSSNILPSIASLAACILFAYAPAAALAAPGSLGIFVGQQDVGTVLHTGSAQCDSATGAYTVSGSGRNMWGSSDDFHFVWKKMSGDVVLTADIAFLGSSAEPHRKAVLMIRQNLDGNSPTVYVAVHGNGLTSLQFRDAPGAGIQEIQSNVTAPKTVRPQAVRIEKRDDFFYVFVAGPDGKLEPSGASIRLALTEPFYVGIGVCAHSKDAVERAVFSHVRLDQLPPATGKPVLVSALETVPIATGDRHVEYVAAARFEAPNWSRDGSFFIFNQGGRILKLALGSSQPAVIDTAPEIHCNNDHGISPDGTMLAISDSSEPDGDSRVYVVPISGGTPRQLTPEALSYWHGWSPDGKTIAFTGWNGSDFDIYTVPVTGGPETRLTTAEGLDDGPEYSPDGQYIYFNSVRTGQMQIWRMKADGSNQEQVIADDTNDWFPHISPDGQWMEFLAYDKSVTGHPAEKNVELMLMSMKDKKVHVLASLFGGQGTINVPSWSPDSKKIAFVSYELLPAEDLSPQ
jgi:TolB protein